MASRKKLVGELAAEYRTVHGKEMPTLKLARIMYNENKPVFSSIDHARAVLRYHEGKMGGKARKELASKEFLIVGDRPKNPYKLPPSDEISFEPFLLEAKRVLLLSDVHIPYHSIEAITACFDYAKKLKPDCVLLNGDILDFHGLSRFCKDPRKRKFSEELDYFQEFFSIILKTFKGAKVVFKFGNHEQRYEHFLFMKAKELVGVDEFELEQIIKKRAPGVSVIKDKRIINFNGLNIIHGHEFSHGFFNPVNVARGLYLRGKTSAIQGHSHQSAEHTEPDMNGKITTTWGCGCLCELHPDYSPINKWNHGFVIIDKTENGFEVMNKRIYDGRVL